MKEAEDIMLADRKYDILSISSLAEVETHVLKHRDTFGIFGNHGGIAPIGGGEQGLYHRGTRYLSRMGLWMGPERPVLLSATVRRDNALLTVDLTNPDFTGADGRAVPHGVLHFFRAKLLWQGACYEHVRIRNYGREPVRFAFAFCLEADYADLFEVRGTRREARGQMLDPALEDDRLVLGYRGLDDVLRKTHVAFAPTPAFCSAEEVRYEMTLAPQEHADVYLRCFCLEGEAPVPGLSYEEAKAQMHEADEAVRAASCAATTSDEQFNAWLDRSLDDLNLLLTEVPEGYYPYAGIPWYNTVFGRDGLLTALMTLWVNPAIARGVLGHLAATQADAEDPANDAEPGKILHEARHGEMAALGEVPFRQYYGTVDATPLFVLLAGKYYAHTGDRAFIERIWPNIERALRWIDTYGDGDGDGFVEYQAQSEDGLTQQGWKDSEDSVFHADGTLAEGPIALCEVQGYVYAAKKEATALAEMLGKEEQAERLWRQARRLKAQFADAFWCDDLSMYALALDGRKRPCRVRTSNAGHALFTGIAEEEHARQMAEALFADDMFSGWGIRTLSTRERRFNPMAYHNGSVWPHDNALIGWGLARYGYKEHVHRLLEAFFGAASYDALRRLPELFCGFARRSGEGPTPYPVACAPQAWATAAVFCLLDACLGLSVEPGRGRVVFQQPSLPPFLPEVELSDLRVGASALDLAFQRYGQTTCIEVMRRTEDVAVITRT